MKRYSQRKAVTGSTLRARLAGRYAARPSILRLMMVCALLLARRESNLTYRDARLRRHRENGDYSTRLGR